MPFDPKQFTTRSALEGLYGPRSVDAFDWNLPPMPPLTRWQRARNKLRRVSYDARWWVAAKVLRLPMLEDE